MRICSLCHRKRNYKHITAKVPIFGQLSIEEFRRISLSRYLQCRQNQATDSSARTKTARKLPSKSTKQTRQSYRFLHHYDPSKYCRKRRKKQRQQTDGCMNISQKIRNLNETRRGHHPLLWTQNFIHLVYSGSDWKKCER